MDLDDLGHRVAVGELDIVEETAAQEGVGQFLFIVRGDDDDRAFLRGHRLVGLIDMEGHAIEFLEQIVREFDVGLVDLVDQQRSEEHTSELQSLMRISYAVFCLKKKNRDGYRR